jgi:hypothetical protein
MTKPITPAEAKTPFPRGDTMREGFENHPEK